MYSVFTVFIFTLLHTFDLIVLLFFLCALYIKLGSLDGGPRLISPLGTVKSLKVSLYISTQQLDPQQNSKRGMNAMWGYMSATRIIYTWFSECVQCSSLSNITVTSLAESRELASVLCESQTGITQRNTPVMLVIIHSPLSMFRIVKSY